MRSFYRMLAVLTVLAGVGSFVVDSWRLRIEYSSLDKQAEGAAIRASRETLKKICKWQVYEAARQRLRDAYGEAPKGDQWAPEHLGIDWNYTYFYDFAADELYCTRRKTPGGPAVLSDKPERNGILDHPFVRLCICFIAVCGAALAIARTFR